MSPAHTGGCACGAVRYEIDEALTEGVYCHCKRCQRRSGTAASANAFVPPGALRVVQGEELVRCWEPPDGAAKCFCAECGSALFSRFPGDPPRYGVRMGGLDEDPGITFVRRQWLSSAATWEPVPDDGLPRLDGPPS